MDSHIRKPSSFLHLNYRNLFFVMSPFKLQGKAYKAKNIIYNMWNLLAEIRDYLLRISSYCEGRYLGSQLILLRCPIVRRCITVSPSLSLSLPTPSRLKEENLGTQTQSLEFLQKSAMQPRRLLQSIVSCPKRYLSKRSGLTHKCLSRHIVCGI